MQQLGLRRQACFATVAAAAVYGGGGEQQLAHDGVLLQGNAFRCLVQQGSQGLPMGSPQATRITVDP